MSDELDQMEGKNLQARPGRPKRVMRLCWERLAEEPVRNDFNSHLCEKFSHMPEEVGDLESEWTLFKTTIVEVAARSCGQRLVGACHGGNPRTRWWTPAVLEAIRLEAFRAWLAQEGPDAADRYRLEGRRLGKQNLWHGRSSGRSWKVTFNRPQRGSGTPSGDSGYVGVVSLKLCSAGVAVLLPRMRISLEGGGNTLRSF